MKKSIFLILPAVMLMLASCMDSAGGNGGAGSVRVVLPGASRAVSSSDRADSYTVSLLKGGSIIESQTAVPGGAVEFDEVDAGSYTVDVEASLSGSLSGVGSAEVAVSEGETASCSVLMSRVYTAAQAAERISGNNGENWNIIVAGSITDNGLSEIAGRLLTVPSDGRISLDLSRTTGLSSIGTDAFKDCASLSSIVLPKGITEIGDNAFFYCSSLTRIEIPDSVTTIGASAFSSCSVLKSVAIPFSVTEIGSNLFYGCQSLESIEIPEGITTLGNEFTFYNCKSLESVILPNSLTEIGGSAFESCSALKSITIPPKINKISIKMFKDCENLKTITFLGEINSVESNAFENCNILTTVNYGGNQESWNKIDFGTGNDLLKNAATIICCDGTITNS